VVSKPSIGFKIKADWSGQPQEYLEYFEDWTFQSDTEIESEGGFATTSINDTSHDDSCKDDARSNEADNNHGSMAAQSKMKS